MTCFADSLASGNFQLSGYRCDELIYQSATTTVYRGIETASQQRVVIKVLSQDYPSFEEIVRFRNQYAIAKNLPIAGIIRPLKLLPCGNGYGLVMEDCAGQSLGQYARQQPLGVVAVLEIAIQLAQTLHGLHQHRVIHKDIKPDNIVIHPASGQVKLGDFSIASRLPKETQRLQSPSRLEGTLAYLAPEQTGRMNRTIDYRTDFYGLGVTLYELLTGQLPFASADPLALIHSHIAQLPLAVDQVNAAIPTMVSRVVAKLMAKNAEDRYQSALGLKYDLETCLAQWKTQGAIADFDLGQRDVGDRFVIPEKLYGREVAVHTLLAAFERVAQGQTELMLVVGRSGIGKRAVVNEVHKPITRQQGYFIKGKFDQFNRDVPFSAFVQAFRSLMSQLLGEGDTALDRWRSKIMAAVGDNGQVLIDVMPELVHIIGPQPIVPELPSAAAQTRFHRLFGQFIQLFTTPAHPLVIFLDDLQWADSASLDLLKILMAESAAGYLLLVGAYRDNEVFPAHPLMLTVEQIHQQGIPLNTLTLRPLNQLDTNQLVADTLSCEGAFAVPLSELVYQKTKGNPFFTTQFLQGLYDDGEITFDPDAGHWQCDLTSISQSVLLDDVVGFLSARLGKLPQETQSVLKVAACLGNRFDLETLSVLCERSSDVIAQDLWRSLQVGLVSPESQTYKFFMGDEPPQSVTKSVTLRYRFLHDRVQQAAYALIADEDKPAHHLKIGQLLLANRLLANRDESSDKNDLFQALNNLNKGIELIEDSEQRLQLASLNLEAGQSAKVAMAYAEAVTYFEQGLDLLLPYGWERQYSRVVALYSELASVQFLRGDFGAVQAVSDSTAGHVQEYADALPIYIAQISSDLSQGNMAVGFELGRQVLDSLGVHIPIESNDVKVQQRLSFILAEFKGKTLDDFLASGPSEDARFLGTQELLTLMLGCVYKVMPDLFPLVICEQVSLSLRCGNTPASASIYAAYGMLLCGSHDFESGFWAGEVALALRDAFPEKQFEMRVRNFVYSYITPWKQLLRDSLTPLKQGFNLGREVGDLEYTAYGIHHYVQFLYFSGVHLATVVTEISTACQFLESCRQEGPLMVACQYFHQTVLNLIQGSDEPWQLEGEIFQESKFEESCQINDLGFLFAAQHVNKLVLSVLFGNFTLALDYAAVATVSYKSLFGEFQLAYLHCYRAIAQLAVLESQPSEVQSEGLARVAADLSTLETFATHAPMNFQHQVDLVRAERYRLLGQRLEAMDAYDRAIAGAKANGYIQEEALANELAANFFVALDKVNVAAGYMQDAYYCYARWGADAKVADLQTRYPHLLGAILKSSAGSHDFIDMLTTVAAPNISVHASPQERSPQANLTNLNQTFDFTSILQASQALASTLHWDELLRQLTPIILQNSGGDRCALMLPNDSGEWQVRAIATPEIANFDRAPLDGHTQLPVQLIQYVKNRQEIVVIDDCTSNLPIQDRFLMQAQPKSVLCIPLLSQGTLLGIVYLSHQSISGLFNRDRITVLNFLCSQAAIALENSRLYQLEQNRAAQLAESESRLQTLFDQAADAVFLLSEKKGFVDCNQSAVELFQYTDKSAFILHQPHQISPERQPNGQLSQDKAREMIEAAVHSGSHRFEWLHQSGRGGNFWTEVTLTPVKSQGEIIFHCLVRDISARKLLEQEQAILTGVLEATPDYIGIANTKGEEIWCNQQLKSLRPDLNNPSQQGISDYHPEWVNDILFSEAMPTAIQWGSWSGELAILDVGGHEIPISLVFMAHKGSASK